MLYGTADTASNIYFRTYRYASLADLKGMFAETGVNGGTAGTYFAMEFFGQFAQEVETFF